MPSHNIICSGYFAPIHGGHISYLREASKLGRLFVIVNNDYQTKLKQSIPFMGERERLLLIKSLKYVHNAIISIDKDNSVVESIKYIYDIYNKINPNNIWSFANGGNDRLLEYQQNQQEIILCKEYNINILSSIGGNIKYNSSSKLISAAAQKWIDIYYNKINKNTISKYIKNNIYPKCSLQTRNELNRVLHDYRRDS